MDILDSTLEEEPGDAARIVEVSPRTEYSGVIYFIKFDPYFWQIFLNHVNLLELAKSRD